MKSHLVVTPGSGSIVGYSLDDPIALVDRRGLVGEACVERPRRRITIVLLGGLVEEACKKGLDGWRRLWIWSPHGSRKAS